MSDEKDGTYCSICGGIPPSQIKIRRIIVEGKEIGIDKLDWVLEEVKKCQLQDDTAISEEILKRVKQFNYIPTKKLEVYRSALLEEYRKQLDSDANNDNRRK